VIAIKDHMHTLKDKTLSVILERQYALAAQNTGTVLGDEILNPRKELVWIKRLVGLDRNRLHLFVVVVLEAVSVMMMVMAVLMIVIVMVVVIMIIMMVIIGVQKRRLDVENTIEIEGVAAEHFIDVDLGALGAVQPRVGIETTNARLKLTQFFGGHQIGLVDQYDVRERNLVLRLGRILQPVRQPFRISYGDDRIQFGPRADCLIHEERLRHGRGIRQARRLDDDRVEFSLAPHQAIDDAHEVAPHGAADASVVHLEYFLVSIDHEVVVDADFAEFIDDDRKLLAVRFGQDAIEKRGLAGAEIAGENRDGYF